MALERRSALADHDQKGGFGAEPPGEPGAHIRERRGLALFQLDGPAEDSGFLNAAREALGFGLPTAPGTSTGDGARAALWAGPNRWTIRAPEADKAELGPKLSTALIGRRGALTELGQARTVIRVEGASARDLLNKGCPLDLHPRSFPDGACGTSQLAGVTAQIHHAEEGAFDLYVFRSFGLHLWEWLQEVGAEYGGRIGEAIAG